MSLRLILLIVLIGGAAATTEAKTRWQSCLPAEVTADEVISSEPSLKGGATRQVTIADKLNQLGARCRNRRLVDARGRKIHFYRLIGCWGNPPENYQKIIEDQQCELARLRRRYRVVEISCNPSGVMLQ